MNIVLIGMRGSGKTAVGRLLAARLRREFIETDELIVQRVGLSIPDIVRESGWERFRREEAQVVQEVSGRDGAVIATGGGVVVKEKNIQQLRRKGKLFWLKAGLDALLARTGDDPYRPSLTGKPFREDMESVLTERTPIYERSADFIVDAEGKTPEQVVEEIVEILTERGLA